MYFIKGRYSLYGLAKMGGTMTRLFGPGFSIVMLFVHDLQPQC